MLVHIYESHSCSTGGIIICMSDMSICMSNTYGMSPVGSVVSDKAGTFAQSASANTDLWGSRII